MVSFDLKEAYLPVPVHPASRHFLRFLLRDTVYQFQALCFGLSTAPQVFTWVMAPVSPILHSLGIRMRRYLVAWLVQSSSQGYPYASIPRRLAGPVFLSGVSPRGSSDCPPTLSRFGACHPSQEVQPHTFPVVQYLWVVIDSTSFRASPSVERISRLRSTAAVFLSCASPDTGSLWLSLLGILS